MITGKKETRNSRVNLADVVPLPAPFTVRIDPCGACNFKCVFCPCNQSDYKKQERHQRMTWDIFLKVLDGLKEWAKRDVIKRPGKETSLKVVDFHGFGEPLLNPLLADMVREIKRARVCREIRLVTNGSLLTAKKSKDLIDAGLDLCRVSIYALDRMGYKQICGVGLDPSCIIANVKCFYNLSRGTGSKISAKIISSTLRSQEDVKSFYQIYDSITDFSFIEEVGTVWPKFKVNKEANIGKHVHGTYKDICDVIKKSSMDRPICTMPFIEMQVHADGIVSPCSSDWRRELSYGNVMNKGIENLWQSSAMLELCKMHLNRKAYIDLPCKSCMVACDDNIDKDVEIILKKLCHIHC